METFCTHPSLTSFNPPMFHTSDQSSLAERGRDGAGFGVSTVGFGVSTVLGKLISAIFVFIFALVGSLIGTMTGAFIGQATESGFFRGAAIGAISGAVFSIEVFESTLLLWQSDESGVWSFLYMVDVFSNLLSGRLVRDQVGPVMFSAVENQMSAVERTAEEVPDIFAMDGTKGLSGESVNMLPKMRITATNNVDASGEHIGCSVCLQDFQVGETVRSLPHCQHLFHLPCIDNWLIRHASCPLCRRDI
ncbi:NEP1-interacting-like protein 1 [Cinnamomum micranthum f. kanehirae]|uniref:NEP1-interacting-like protein 1 n=1 Tax=Cinnamomum micranthum f. kanehirae TaxID=337451 RepID=A0A443P1A4_9MAGN|nr:NEP1-interacting-like protein 1 [Cinnamomum micranthum f. kanehirae]